MELATITCRLHDDAGDPKLAKTVDVDVKAESEVFQTLTRAIMSRSRTLISTIMDKYETRRDVILLYQSLAYIMEHGRFSHRRYMNIRHVNAECADVKLDLNELISFPKQCSNKGCIKDGIISCSRCSIASWCGPECLEVDYGPHQVNCSVGEYFQQQLGL